MLAQHQGDGRECLIDFGRWRRQPVLSSARYGEGSAHILDYGTAAALAPRVRVNCGSGVYGHAVDERAFRRGISSSHR